MMKGLFFLICLTICPTGFASSPTGANKELMSLLSSIVPGHKNTKIKTHGCSFQKEKWTLMLISKEPFKETIQFNKNCDLQGSFTAKMSEFFAVKLQIKNIESYKQINAKMKIDLVFDQTGTVLKAQLQDALAHGKKPVHFNADYSVLLDPFSSPILKKHIGGKLFVKSIGLKKIYKTYPLLFK